jgi:hypothetical protein
MNHDATTAGHTTTDDADDSCVTVTRHGHAIRIDVDEVNQEAHLATIVKPLFLNRSAKAPVRLGVGNEDQYEAEA